MSSQPSLTRLLTHRTRLLESRVDVQPLPPPGPGEVILAIDRVAVTTNNVTYAVMGDAMQYWSFFPSGEEGWGIVPAWGLADVVASDVPGVAVGERFYGYFPMASHLRVAPARVSSRGFHDATPHRASLAAVYNQYTRCATDPAYDAALEDHQMLLRPLVITSFFVADFLTESGFFGAQQLLISSASSKTAYGTAFCLAGAGVEVVGLTSEKNRAFVESLGAYARVVTYEALDGLEASTKTAYLDIAGGAGLRERVHLRFGSALVYDCMVGFTHIGDLKAGLAPDALPGAKPEAFFAPSQIAKRRKELGDDEVDRRVGAMERTFYARAADPARPWVSVTVSRGLEGAATLLRDFVMGRVNPADGHVVAMRG